MKTSFVISEVDSDLLLNDEDYFKQILEFVVENNVELPSNLKENYYKACRKWRKSANFTSTEIEFIEGEPTKFGLQKIFQRISNLF